ncbi:MAG: hypothetical protein ACRC37_00565 [Lentisphaeria bacterium]
MNLKRKELFHKVLYHDWCEGSIENFLHLVIRRWLVCLPVFIFNSFRIERNYFWGYFALFVATIIFYSPMFVGLSLFMLRGLGQIILEFWDRIFLSKKILRCREFIYTFFTFIPFFCISVFMDKAERKSIFLIFIFHFSFCLIINTIGFFLFSYFYKGRTDPETGNLIWRE